MKRVLAAKKADPRVLLMSRRPRRHALPPGVARGAAGAERRIEVVGSALDQSTTSAVAVALDTLGGSGRFGRGAELDPGSWGTALTWAELDPLAGGADSALWTALKTAVEKCAPWTLAFPTAPPSDEQGLGHEQGLGLPHRLTVNRQPLVSIGEDSGLACHYDGDEGETLLTCVYSFETLGGGSATPTLARFARTTQGAFSFHSRQHAWNNPRPCSYDEVQLTHNSLYAFPGSDVQHQVLPRSLRRVSGRRQGEPPDPGGLDTRYSIVSLHRLADPAAAELVRLFLPSKTKPELPQ